MHHGLLESTLQITYRVWMNDRLGQGGGTQWDAGTRGTYIVLVYKVVLISGIGNLPSP